MPVVRRRRAPVRFRTPLPDDHPVVQALDAQVPADHPARIIRAAIDGLDLSGLVASYHGTGSDAFPPSCLLAVTLFEAREGCFSPAGWLKHSCESLPVRWLLRGLSPARSTWYAFRDRLPAPLLELAHQAVRAALDQSLATAERAAVDGTLVAANSTRHHLLNANALSRRAGQIDDADGSHGPPAPAPGWVGKTARGRGRQRRHYSRLGRQMQRRLGHNQAKRASKRKPADQVRISPGDPEAALGLDKDKVYRPLYNVQLLADVDSPLVLSYQVAAQANDAGLLGGLLAQARSGLGRAPRVVLADSGYAGGPDLAGAEAAGVRVYAPWQSNDYSQAKEPKWYPKDRFTYLAEQDAYECPAGQRLKAVTTTRVQRSGAERIELTLYRAEKAACQACPQRPACTAGSGRTVSRSEHEGAIERLRQRMATDEARALYRLRKQTVERLNADLKQHRRLRRFTGRGLARALAEVGLAVLAHNLTALLKLRDKKRAAANPPQTPP